MAMATRAYWLMGLLYPTAEVGRFFIWLLFLNKQIARGTFVREHKFLLRMHPNSGQRSSSTVSEGWPFLVGLGLESISTCRHLRASQGPCCPPPARGTPLPLCPWVASAGAERGTYPPVGTSGWNFHWSSSPSKYRRFMILFFSSGGMKFSMIKYLSE